MGVRYCIYCYEVIEGQCLKVEGTNNNFEYACTDADCKQNIMEDLYDDFVTTDLAYDYESEKEQEERDNYYDYLDEKAEEERLENW